MQERPVPSETDVRTYYFADARFDPADGRILSPRGAVTLRPKTAAVLRVLLDRADRVVTRRTLIDAVWESPMGDEVISVCVNELRRALGDDARRPRFIATAHRVGYRFLAPVSVSVPSLAGAGADLVGRPTERARLDAWWAASVAGTGQVALVGGDAGIGKSALVGSWAAEVARRTDVVLGTGRSVVQTGPGEPFLPFLEAFTALCQGAFGGRVRSRLRSAAPSWLRHLPVLARDGESWAYDADGAGPHRMLREAADALDMIGRDGPVLLILEDLQWADPASVELLSFLAQRGARGRWLLVGTFRDAEVGQQAAFARLVRSLDVHRPRLTLRVPPLDHDQVGELLGLRFAGARPRRTFVSDVYERTEGHPLLLEILVDDLIEQGLVEVFDGEVRSPTGVATVALPETWLRIVEHRLEGLESACRRLLERAATTGLHFTAEDVAEGPGHRGETALLLSRLAAWGVLVRTGEAGPHGEARFGFAHRAFREALALLG